MFCPNCWVCAKYEVKTALELPVQPYSVRITFELITWTSSTLSTGEFTPNSNTPELASCQITTLLTLSPEENNFTASSPTLRKLFSMTPLPGCQLLLIL